MYIMFFTVIKIIQKYLYNVNFCIEFFRSKFTTLHSTRGNRHHHEDNHEEDDSNNIGKLFKYINY